MFSSKEFLLAGDICQKLHSIWAIWDPRAPFLIYTPNIWSHHTVRDYHTQITRKYSTAMCYSDSICRVLVMMMMMMMDVVIMMMMIVMMMLIINQLDDDFDHISHITHFGHISLKRHFSNIILIILL